ncbi:hypothetical protein BD410DRAFT_844793 [Rickenella mellea]|uniref:Uncharacterized protein n=1 Tax=Rickenella mellea TaxID=50990 RepID=A0A4Y7PLU5_9AGAM|nr:hypothetical protein BD410DRAFT_844793 [Rickenella mellea]
MAAKDTIGKWTGVLATISDPMSFIPINRLVLNLRQVSHEAHAPTLGTVVPMQEPAYAINSLLGNLGAPLRMGPEDDEIEDVGVDDAADVAEDSESVDHTGIIEEPRDPSDV